jgi:hypothetical protein
MTWWVIPVKMPPAEILIAALPIQVFDQITAFARSSNADGPKILRIEDNGDLVVEFRSEVTGVLGRRKIHRTVERVTLEPPVEVRFSGIEGPLDLLSDRFALFEAAGGTLFRYESTVGLRGSLLGWLVCRTYVSLVLGRFMRQHVSRVKEAFS